MTRTLMAATAALLLAGNVAHADAIEDFYKGRSLSFIIGSNNGGSYDSYGRLFAAHFGRHVPGNPTIVPQNMPGASGIKSATFLYQIAPKDGATIGTFNQSMGQRQVLDPQAVQFDVSKFNWIGAMASSVNVFITWHTSGVRTIEDAKTKQVVMGALSDDGGNAVYPFLLNKFLGTRFKVVLGYQGGNTIQLAMERGEVDGRGSVIWSGFKAGWPQWIAEHKVNILVQLGLQKDPDLPDVPLLIELANDDTQRQIFRLISSDTIMGFPVAAPPGAPADRVAALRTAFADTLADPAFVSDAAKRNLPVRPSPGDEVQRVMTSIITTPPEVIAVLKAAIAEAKPDSKAAR
ncbi:MAG: Bug family tripartite tricarboxylate transporter substrate binding protein [Gemmatimonas sp.]